jgi:hypothetical protein
MPTTTLGSAAARRSASSDRPNIARVLIAPRFGELNYNGARFEIDGDTRSRGMVMLQSYAGRRVRVIRKSQALSLGRFIIVAALGFANAGFAAVPAVSCDQFAQRIPQRSAAALPASNLVQRLQGMNEVERETAVAAQLLAGNIPDFLRRLAPIRLTGHLPGGRTVHVTFCTLPDYLAIGSDEDFMLIPMRLQTALVVADSYGFLLPTTKMVDAIYEQASLRLAPQPLPAGAEMRSTDYYWRHNQRVAEQRSNFGLSLGVLTAGDKKDLVLSNRLWRNPRQLAIYGWHRAIDRPIQPLSTIHGAHYVDYSHGVRLVAPVAYVDGEARSLLDVLKDTQLASMLSDEGAIQHLVELLDILKAPSHSTLDR